ARCTPSIRALDCFAPKEDPPEDRPFPTAWTWMHVGDDGLEIGSVYPAAARLMWSAVPAAVPGPPAPTRCAQRFARQPTRPVEGAHQIELLALFDRLPHAPSPNRLEQVGRVVHTLVGTFLAGSAGADGSLRGCLRGTGSRRGSIVYFRFGSPICIC